MFHRSWAFGAVWGIVAATAATLLLLASTLLSSWTTPETAEVNPRVLAAWWIATPLCGGVAASQPPWFNRLRTAIPWAVACSAPWVAAIHLAARGELPSTAGGWSSVAVRSLVLGASAGIVAWRTVRGSRSRAAAPEAEAAEGDAEASVLVVTHRADLAGELQRHFAKTGRSTVVLRPHEPDEARADPLLPVRLLWDVELRGDRDLRFLGEVVERFPALEALLVDRGRSGGGIRVARFLPGPRPTSLLFDVALWRARWTPLRAPR